MSAGGGTYQDYMQRLQQAQMQAALVRSPYYNQMLQCAPVQMGYGGGLMGKGDGGYGTGGYGTWGYEGGKGKSKGKKGKGKGKGKFKRTDAEGTEEGEKKEDGEEGEKKEGEEGEKKEPRQPSTIAGAQREARFRADSRLAPIVNAQRDARLRFEKDVLDRIQGYWVDEADPKITYAVEGNICSVSNGDGGRGFRNRLSVYGHDMCWDARRWWHYLNLPDLYAQGEDVQRLEWNPAKDSPPAQQITWTKTDAPPPTASPSGLEVGENGEQEGNAAEEKPKDETDQAEAS